jgi:hypothetical protein
MEIRIKSEIVKGVSVQKTTADFAVHCGFFL